MKTLPLKKPEPSVFPMRVFNTKRILARGQSTRLAGLFCLLLLLWLAGTTAFQNDPMAAPMDTRNLYLLIVLSLLCFLGLLGLCWWLLEMFWSRLRLPNIYRLIIHFKTLPPWLQLGFAWASFALLLLAAIGCLIAIC